MSGSEIHILVEEPSAEAFLCALLPRVLGEQTVFRVFPYQGKDDLLTKLPNRLAGYRRWSPPGLQIFVLVDRDADDCHALKARMDEIACTAGLYVGRRTSAHGAFVINRIAIEELEAWYFGDWAAVVAAYPRISKKIPLQEKYRKPDEIKGGTWEALERVLKSAGYYSGGLQKTRIARDMGEHMDPARNISPSFRVFFDSLITDDNARFS